MTLVHEGNYLSHTRHIWQGGTPKVHVHVIRTAVSAEWTHPQTGSCGNSSLATRVPRHLSRDPEGWSTPLLMVNPRQAPDHFWDGRAPHTRVLPHATLISLGISHQGLCPSGLRTSSALLPTWLQRSFLARHWRLPCPPCFLLDLQTETLGLGFIIPHWLLCVCVTVILDC